MSIIKTAISINNSIQKVLDMCDDMDTLTQANPKLDIDSKAFYYRFSRSAGHSTAIAALEKKYPNLVVVFWDQKQRIAHETKHGKLKRSLTVGMECHGMFSEPSIIIFNDMIAFSKLNESRAYANRLMQTYAANIQFMVFLG